MNPLLLAVALLACAAQPPDTLRSPSPAAPTPSSRTRTGVVTGVCGYLPPERAFEPLEFANVVVVGTRRGALTDSQGSFTIPSVAEGTRLLRFQAIGFDPDTLAVRVNGGETTFVKWDARPKAPPSGTTAIHSPREDLRVRLGRATSIRVYRLDPTDDARSGSPRVTDDLARLGVWRIVREGRPPSERDRDAFVALLRDSTSWARGPEDDAPCHRMPGVGVRLRGADGLTDIEFCLECDVAFAQADGIWMPERGFHPALARVVRFFRSSFPNDRALRAPERRERAPARR